MKRNERRVVKLIRYLSISHIFIFPIFLKENTFIYTLFSIILFKYFSLISFIPIKWTVSMEKKCGVTNKKKKKVLEQTKRSNRSQRIPCLLSTSISEVSAVPPTVHSSTGAHKFATWSKYHSKSKYWVDGPSIIKQIKTTIKTNLEEIFNLKS